MLRFICLPKRVIPAPITATSLMLWTLPGWISLHDKPHSPLFRKENSATMGAAMNCVLVPVKALAQGKSRLSVCLSAEERYALSRAMLTDVLTSARSAAGVDRVVVVSSDPSL